MIHLPYRRSVHPLPADAVLEPVGSDLACYFRSEVTVLLPGGQGLSAHAERDDYRVSALNPAKTSLWVKAGGRTLFISDHQCFVGEIQVNGVFHDGLNLLIKDDGSWEPVDRITIDPSDLLFAPGGPMTPIAE